MIMVIMKYEKMDLTHRLLLDSSDIYGAGPELAKEAVEEIKILRTALQLCIGELSTHGEYQAWTPDMLYEQFIKEARDAISMES